jgi:hypothetical protein
MPAIDRQQLKARWKQALSYLKSEWSIDDYPVRLKYQADEQTPPGSSGKVVPWVAQVVNWWQLAGYGNTPAEARLDLAQRFLKQKDTRATLPRPGTHVEPEFASNVEIQKFDRLAVGFLDRVLGLDASQCFISDETSLGDFHDRENNEHLNDRILEIYGVDVSDIKGGNLAKIFERLTSRGQA